MKCPRAVIVLALTAVAAFAAEVRAQTAELFALGGYGFGGSLTAPASGADVPIEAGVLYGGAFSMPIAGTWRVDGLITRQESRVTEMRIAGGMSGRISRMRRSSVRRVMGAGWLDPLSQESARARVR